MFTRCPWIALFTWLLTVAPVPAHDGGKHPTGFPECVEIGYSVMWFHLYGTGIEHRDKQDPFDPQEYVVKSDSAEGYAPQATIKIAWAIGAGHITTYSDFNVTIKVGNSRSYIYDGSNFPNTWVIKPYIDGWSGVFTVLLQHKRCNTSMVARARWSMENPCATCPILSCAGEAEIKSVDIGIPVGVTGYGGSAIQLAYVSDQLANEGPAKLAVRGAVNVNGASVQKTNNIITSVTSGDHYAVVVPDPPPEDPDSNRFRIDVSYDKNDPANTIYRQAVIENIVLPGGTPALCYTDSTAGRTDLRIFTQPDADTWTLEENALRRTTKTKISETTTHRTFRFLLEEKDAAGNYVPVSVREETETRHAWGWEKTSEVLDPDGEALTTTWDYYDDDEFSAPTGDIIGRGSLQSVTYPTGLTRSHDYYDDNPLDPTFTQLTITREAFAGIPGAREFRRHSTSNGSTLTERVETWINGILVEHTDIAAGSGGGGVTRTETRYAAAGGSPHVTQHFHESNPYTPLEQRTVFPDGTIEEIHATYAGGIKTTSTWRGVENPGGGLPILTGTEDLVATNDAGQVLHSATYRIRNGSAYRIEERIAAAFDELSRPVATAVFHDSQTAAVYTETTTYGCCGVSSRTGRDGIATHHFYDALGRRTKTHHNGLATETVYDGLTTRTHRYPEEVPSGLSLATAATEVSNRTRNLVGDTVGESGRSPQDGSLVGTTRQTVYAPGSGLGRRVVQTLPQVADDLGVAPTITEDYYLDGRLASRTGPLVADRQTTYGATAEGITSTTSLLDGNGSPYQSVTTRNDWLARAVSRTYSGDADGNGQPDRELFAYDLGGRIVRQTDPDGVTRLWDYDLLDEITTSALDLNGNGAIDPDFDELRVSKAGLETNADGRTVLWSEEYVRDTPGTETLVARSETRADGLESWSYTYEGVTAALTHSLTTRPSAQPGDWDITVRSPDQTTVVRRVRGGLLDGDEAFDAGGLSLAARTYHYDDHQRLVRVDDTSGPTEAIGYVTPLVDAVASRTIGTRTTSFDYDHRGRRTVVDEPDSLDATGAAVDNRRVTAYWPHGGVREVTGTPGHHLAYTYDDALRIGTLTTHGTTTAVTRWTYDPDRGWLTGKRHDSPAPGTGSGPTFTYTPGGRLDTQTSPRGIVTDHDYGLDGRLSRTDYSDGTPSTVIHERDRRGRVSRLGDGAGERHFSYDNQSGLAAVAYQAGHLLAGWSVHQSRDAIRRLDGLTLRQGGVDRHDIGYTYDDAGRLDSVRADGLAAFYHYDPAHLGVTQLSIVSHLAPLLYASRSYDELNRLDRISYHDGNLGGTLKVYSDYHYARDTYGRITSATMRDKTQWRYAYHPSGELATARRFVDSTSAVLVAGHTHAWAYDGIGNRTGSETGGDSSGAGLQTSTYAPNALNQLATVQRPGTVEIFGEAPLAAEVTVNGTAASRHGPFFRHELTADNSAGPLWQPVTIQGAGDTTTGHLLVAPAQATRLHDADGNLVDDGIHQFTWDAENRLVEVETTAAATSAGIPYARVHYTYDSDSRRLQRLEFDAPAATTPVASTRYLYAGWRCLGELDTAGTLARTLTWGLDNHHTLHLGDANGALLWLDDKTAGETHLAHFDGNGNLTGLSSAQTKHQTAHYLYSPFGKLLAATGPYAHQNPYRHSTHPQDPATGHTYYGYRHYDSDTGRWLSRDPIGEDGGVNLYGFAGNDGMNDYDVLGGSAYTDWVTRQVHGSFSAARATFHYQYYEFPKNVVRAGYETVTGTLGLVEGIQSTIVNEAYHALHPAYDYDRIWGGRIDAVGNAHDNLWSTINDIRENPLPYLQQGLALNEQAIENLQNIDADCVERGLKKLHAEAGLTALTMGGSTARSPAMLRSGLGRETAVTRLRGMGTIDDSLLLGRGQPNALKPLADHVGARVINTSLRGKALFKHIYSEMRKADRIFQVVDEIPQSFVRGQLGQWSRMEKLLVDTTESLMAKTERVTRSSLGF